MTSTEIYCSMDCINNEKGKCAADTIAMNGGTYPGIVICENFCPRNPDPVKTGNEDDEVPFVWNLRKLWNYTSEIHPCGARYAPYFDFMRHTWTSVHKALKIEIQSSWSVETEPCYFFYIYAEKIFRFFAFTQKKGKDHNYPPGARRDPCRLFPPEKILRKRSLPKPTRWKQTLPEKNTENNSE